jgi:hypothetical protein
MLKGYEFGFEARDEDDFAYIQAQRELRIVLAGLRRFYDEGYVSWSRARFEEIIGPRLRLDDPRVHTALEEWERAGVIEFVKGTDVFVVVLPEVGDPGVGPR